MSTFTDSTLNAGWNITTLGDAIKVAFTNAGYGATVDDYTTGGVRTLVWGVTAKAGVTYGAFFLRITISATFSVSQFLQTGYNATTKAGTNISGSNTAVTFASGIAVQFKAINNGGEFKLVYLYQVSTTNQQILGYLYPATLNNVDENSFCAALQFTSFNAKTLIGCPTVNPYGNANYNILDFPNMTLANHYNQQDAIPKLFVFSASNKGLFAITSDSLGVAASSGLALFAPIGTYILLMPIATGIIVK